ncbi:histidine kinase [Mucilaginibacter rigui]|uniref:Histidine kinase n=1 Tax=Mucilaginibacter rigui TaxID=534635 RepID=A0ABR7X2U2_9SPHI|nr:histidine kinase [Mucilaginibacter rigui]MBD1384919.1 histidine kinase [Mucilaginibacter rigui]
MKPPRLLLATALLFLYFTCFAQSGFKALTKAAADSAQVQKYDAAIKLLLKAKTLKGRDTAYADWVNTYLGSNYEALNKIDSAIYYYGEAVKYSESKKDNATLAFLYNHLGSIELLFTQRYLKAIDYLNRQLVYTRLMKDSTSLFDCLNNLGIAYKGLNKYDVSLSYFNKVSSNNSKHNSSKNIALLLTGDIYSLMKKYPTALNYYDRAISGLTILNDSTDLFTAYANKGDCLMQQDKIYESIVCFKKAQQFITPYIAKANKVALYHNFAYAYGRQRAFDKAFYFQNLEEVTKDSINIDGINKAVAEMSAKYELRQKQDSLVINKQKLVLADAKTKENERNLIILLVVLIAVTVFFISIYRIRQLRFKNSLQQQEAAQNELKLIHQYQLSESELKAIRSQMNPHFMFNVLNSIESYIMDSDRKTASRLIQKFASLTRLILENSTKSLVTADKEWKALMLYTELEATRYNHAFTYNFIADESLELKTLILPPMLIQPLIENAILHGLIAESRSDAHLDVRLEKTKTGICITVSDNGLGMEKSAKMPKKLAGVKERSIGIAFIKERIEMINLQNNTTVAKFSIAAGENGAGTVATVCLSLLNEGQ